MEDPAGNEIYDVIARHGAPVVRKLSRTVNDDPNFRGLTELLGKLME